MRLVGGCAESIQGWHPESCTQILGGAETPLFHTVLPTMNGGASE